jgi:hypothetical protein
MASHYPEGISERHKSGESNRHVIWWRAGLIALLLVAALVGLLGGAPAPTARATNAAATLAVTTPDRLRNGMLFETRVSALARRSIADAVIALPAGMWRDITVNSMIPAPSEEEFVEGEYRFHFGPLAAGEALTLKIDGQVNPPRYSSSRGRLRLLDGEAELTAVPVSLTVIP